MDALKTQRAFDRALGKGECLVVGPGAAITGRRFEEIFIMPPDEGLYMNKGSASKAFMENFERWIMEDLFCRLTPPKSPDEDYSKRITRL